MTDFERVSGKIHQVVIKRAMPRSLRVRQELIQKVKLAVKRNGFPSQRALAFDVGLALATVSNFLTGKPVEGAMRFC